MKLTKREYDALKDISGMNSHPTWTAYSTYWTPKTNEKLEKKGLVEIRDRKVFITELGIRVLEENSK